MHAKHARTQDPLAKSIVADSRSPDELVENDSAHGVNERANVDDLLVQCPSHTTERALVRKIDWRLLPILCAIYIMAFLDRVNIGNAVIYGLEKDLKLTGTQYNTALTVFFVPYVLFEIPSNVLLRRLRPHVWLPICMFLFGLVMTLQGLVQNFSGLIATRFFLGLTEAGVFPGCFYMIGMWYKRSEAQKRYTLFFSSTQLAGAFGGLLASAIGKMNGIRGYHAWRWIFILEGLLTCVIAIASFFIISDFPDDAKWLTEDERAYINARLQAEQGGSTIDRRIEVHDIVKVFTDYKLSDARPAKIFALVTGYAYFAPTVIETYGYGQIQTQLHSVAPSAAAFVFSILVAILSDLTHHRFLFAFTPICIAIAGVAVLLTVHDNKHLEYGALFLVTMGTFSAMPVVICWFTMNLRGHYARGVGTAWQIGFGNIGGIISTYAFLMKDAPRYERGYAILLGFLCLAALSCVLYLASLWRRENSPDGKAEGGVHRPDPLESHYHSMF
ncbi:MAG: hypothetical protein ASARMPREDX12_002272 [Alectoria sarmentosa]|nr:MAG: hypothetical protein ASARMPREDX12_002272 [Alectoria sarmentosa]